MELTAIAQWLNTAFAGYDYAILQALHKLAEAAGGVFTPLCYIITLLGEKGLLFLALGIALMLFPKTRKMGVCIFGAVCCGALITNFWLKDFVARPRPLTVEPFRTWWQAAGAYAESEYSFPSGHVTAAMAGVTALVLTGKKPARYWAFLFVPVMGIARNYLMAHYPSDVLFAMLIGALSAFIAYLITKAIFTYLEDNDDFPACAAILDFDLPVRLPDKEAVTGFINRAGKGSGRGAKSSGRGGERGGRRAAARSESKGAGGFKAALSAAANAGSGLIGKVGGRKASAEPYRDEDESTAAPKRSKAGSDWNSRWESYKGGRGASRRADDDVREYPVRERAAKPAPAVDDDDADMKIAPPRRAKDDGFNWDAAPAGESAAPERKSAPAPESVPAADDDGIDWASLGLDFLADDDFSAAVEEPVRRRSSASSASRASSRAGGSYKGRHEK